MYEVNFGETILIEDEDEKLVVDCGAKYGGKGKLAAGKILPHLGTNHNKLLISHFDEDHYNGVKEMVGKIIFDKIYLPLYVYDNKKRAVLETLEVLNDTIKVWCYLKLIGKGKKLDELQKLFCSIPLLVNSPRDISCIGKGDWICVSKNRFDILWPERNMKMGKSDYSDEIRIMLSDYQAVLQSLNVVVEEYSSVFSNVYLYYAVHESNQDINTLMGELEYTYAKLDNSILNIKLKDDDTKRINSISSTVIRNMNECSVVAHDKENLLLLGDISRRIYTKKIDGQVSSEYKIIKIAHHGTKAYFCKNIPKAKKYLVSNSGTFNIKWSIYDEYKKRYSNYMNCTNTNIYRCLSVTKSCGDCKIGLSDGSICIDTSLI